MKTALIASLTLLAACEIHTHTTTYPQPPPQTYPGEPPGQTAFVVDANAGVVADPLTYGITTDGVIFRLLWVDDGGQHAFTGNVVCPSGCQFTYARFEGNYGYATPVVQGNQASFDATPNGITTYQVLDLDAPLQPLSFNLAIDGAPAIGAVEFTSNGVRSTTDTMPFSLFSSNSGLSIPDKTKLAPQFISQFPGGTSKSVTVAPPEKQSTAVNMISVVAQPKQ